MFRPVSFLAIGVAFVASMAAQAEAETYHGWFVPEPYDLTKSMATKTSYWDQTKGNDKLLHKADAKDYELIQIQQIIRHGTRFPTEGNTLEIEGLVSKLQSNFSESIPKWLQGYKLPYNVSVEGQLAPAGVTELERMGERTRQKVGQAVPQEYSSEKFLLQHTYKSRTKQSAISFASKFFSNPSDVKYLEYSKKKDPLLRFYDQCPRYIRDVADNPNAVEELDAFMKTPTMGKITSALRKQLKLPKSAEVAIADVQSTYSACAFDLALYDNRKQWCTLLTKDMVQNVEYADDLETFYVEGGGFPINYEISSVLLKDIVKTMKDFLAGTSQLVGNFRFVHGETTLPLMTLLGYVDTNKLRSTWGEKAIDNRNFRTSRLVPFMANLEFGLYRKTSGSDKGDVFVQIRINEKVTEIPGCRGKVFCKLDEVEKIWHYYLTEYNFAEQCKI